MMGLFATQKKIAKWNAFDRTLPKINKPHTKNSHFNRPAPQRSFSPVKPGLSHHPRRSVGAEALLEPEADSAEQHV